MWLLGENDLEQDAFKLGWLNATFIAMRARDAVRNLLGGKISWIMNGEDILTELLLSQGKRLRRESWEVTGFDTYYLSKISKEWEKDPSQGISKIVTFDDDKPQTLRLLTKNGDTTDLEQISKRWDILTSYPYLLRSILSKKFGGGTVGRITELEGKIEVQLANGFGRSAVDIVDTWASAKKNWLSVGPIIYSSLPIWIFREKDMKTDKVIWAVADILTDASNNLYYNSLEYRLRYPRG